jgi:hypothetical protein
MDWMTRQHRAQWEVFDGKRNAAVAAAFPRLAYATGVIAVIGTHHKLGVQSPQVAAKLAV